VKLNKKDTKTVTHKAHSDAEQPPKISKDVRNVQKNKTLKTLKKCGDNVRKRLMKTWTKFPINIFYVNGQIFPKE